MLLVEMLKTVDILAEMLKIWKSRWASSSTSSLKELLSELKKMLCRNSSPRAKKHLTQSAGQRKNCPIRISYSPWSSSWSTTHLVIFTTMTLIMVKIPPGELFPCPTSPWEASPLSSRPPGKASSTRPPQENNLWKGRFENLVSDFNIGIWVHR